MRVAAAENPSVKWGGADLGAYEPHHTLTSSALLGGAITGDVFGKSLQVQS